MSTTPVTGRSDKRMFRRVLAVGFTGTLIEWYDFVVFGTMAALYFGPLFYPGDDPFLSLLASLATFAVGFVARPAGGLFFGYLGDRIGRRITLVITLGIMGVTTFLMGLLPTYEMVGVWAPIMLVVLRIAQGFSLGGEWGGMATLLIEHSPANRRASAGSWGQIGSFAGSLVATVAVALLTSTLADEQMTQWGWRIPFLFSVVLVIISFIARHSVSESPSFAKMRAQGNRTKTPTREALRHNPKQIVAVFLMHGGQTIFFYTCLTFSITFLTAEVGFSSTDALVVNGVFLLTATIAGPIFGTLADRIGRRPIYLAGSITAALVAFPLFWVYGTGDFAVIIPFAVVLGIIEGGLFYAIQPAYFGELFPTRYRYAGLSFGYQLATVALGATAPMIGVSLLNMTGGNPWLFSLYMVVVLVLSGIGVMIAGETLGTDIDAEPEDAADGTASMSSSDDVERLTLQKRKEEI